MEHEIRFYFPKSHLTKLLKTLHRVASLEASSRTFEKTTQYEHPCKEFSFYQKTIDGRFRLRETKSQDYARYKLSWKRRLPKTTSTAVNQEEEVELTILPDEISNFVFIVEKVLHLQPIESYERYRTIFENKEVEIALDEYPFGIAVEIEAKKTAKDPENIVINWAKKIGLDPQNAFRLSWDDKYRELCRSQNVKQLQHMVFGAEMPEVKDE